jgi:ABC-2 type transport system ATP-binding protein
MQDTGWDSTDRSVAALDVEGVTKRYGGTLALRGVDLVVEPGSILGLLGPNGAGKTTLVSIVAGLRRPDAGNVRVGAIDVLQNPRLARAAVGYAPQETGVYPQLPVRDNLRFFAGLSGLRGRELRTRIDAVAGAIGLSHLMGRRASELSGGERRRLHTAMALLHRPNLVLLDEPTTGADIRSRSELLAFVRDLADDGSAVVYSTHYLPEIEELGADVAFIDAGRIVAHGAVAELVRRHATSAVVLTFQSAVPTAMCVEGAVIEGNSVRIPTPDAGATAAQLLARLGPDSAALRSVEMEHPSLESVYLAVTGRRYEQSTEAAA